MANQIKKLNVASRPDGPLRLIWIDLATVVELERIGFGYAKITTAQGATHYVPVKDDRDFERFVRGVRETQRVRAGGPSDTAILGFTGKLPEL